MLTLTESKTEMLLKIGEILGRVHTGIFTVDVLEKIGVLNSPALKIEKLKIVEVHTR